jgi:hypothetical protein
MASSGLVRTPGVDASRGRNSWRVGRSCLGSPLATTRWRPRADSSDSREAVGSHNTPNARQRTGTTRRMTR